MISSRPADRYALIFRIYSDRLNTLTIQEMCAYAGVSRSGYYKWLALKEERDRQEEQDLKDFHLILEAYNHRGYKKGARQIYMRLIRQKPPILMNIKKIRRLMKKYNLHCPIRKSNPYRQMMRKSYNSRIQANILDRKFRLFGPRTVLLTDITYIPFNGEERKRFAYLSTIIDAFTKEVLAYVVSNNLKEDFVLETVNILIRNHKISLSCKTLIHSDQGVHYTSIQFSDLLKKESLYQSMSLRGCCWDNAPQESFFGHMKDELEEKIWKCHSCNQVREAVDDWIDYYNNDRPQEGLAMLTPVEYYEYIQTGIYPLKDVKGVPQREYTEDISSLYTKEKNE